MSVNYIVYLECNRRKIFIDLTAETVVVLADAQGWNTLCVASGRCRWSFFGKSQQTHVVKVLLGFGINFDNGLGTKYRGGHEVFKKGEIIMAPIRFIVSFCFGGIFSIIHRQGCPAEDYSCGKIRLPRSVRD